MFRPNGDCTAVVKGKMKARGLTGFCGESMKMRVKLCESV